MKRFWKEVEVSRDRDGWAIQLDGRPVRTPARAELRVPNAALAQAIADEWRSVGDRVEPRAMPLTGLANAAIDRVAPDSPAFAAGLARYAEADLACYRAEGPESLVQRQDEQWDPLLAWARRRYDVDFCTTMGLLHVAQPGATVERLTHEVLALGPFRLAGLSPLVTIGGSLVTALAILDKGITPGEGWAAVCVDERFQLDHWGLDAEAEAALEHRRHDFMAAAHFLALLEC